MIAMTQVDSDELKGKKGPPADTLLDQQNSRVEVRTS